MTDLLLRNVEVQGRPGLDVAISAGRIESIGVGLPRDRHEVVDGRGGALIPGLIDHHIHFLAFAARLTSIELSAERNWRIDLAGADEHLEPGRWLRALGYHESFAGTLDRHLLDRVVPTRPLRVQHATGALWVLNSAALALLPVGELPSGAERAADGVPTGRFFREDRWLREVLPSSFPDIGAATAQLSRYGVTGFSDASFDNDAATVAFFRDAVRQRRLLQAVSLMSGNPDLVIDEEEGLTLGPMKILLDDERLGDPADLTPLIDRAHDRDRAVAIHCVTRAQLAFAVAALGDGRARYGDRIEHGSLIDDASARELARMRLAVVTQPGFIGERGDRYLETVDIGDHADLYRLKGLIEGGIGVAGSSDAPYGPTDPWVAMRAAVTRRTRSGAVIGAAEAINPRAALALYLGRAADPAGARRRLVEGAAADLCLLAEPLDTALSQLDSRLVRMTIARGEITHQVD